MKELVSRRAVLGMGVGLGAAWVFRVGGDGRIVCAQAAAGEVWSPQVLSGEEARALANVCEAIIPRTDTPGAREARVHEYIDLELSVGSAGEQERFREGLKWVDARCSAEHGHGLAEAADEEVAAVLGPISDEHEEHAAELEPGAAFFRDVKRRTIFGYYTSKEGWVDELGRPEHAGMEQWVGCRHAGGEH